VGIPLTKQTSTAELFMKAYLITTGILFALIVVAHILKAIDEGPGTAKNPFFILLTVLAAGLSVWAFRLLKRA
jgi:hypothetical protein